MSRLIIGVILLLSCVYLNVATPAIKLKSMGGIIFPTNEVRDDCFVDEEGTIKGICKSLSDCPTALERWENEDVRPQTCYFNKFDHIVCCELTKAAIIEPEVYTPPPSAKRRSELECDTYYVVEATVVHGEPTKPKEFPYMAALGWKTNFDDSILYRCGGVLISNKFVLSAAHCAQLGGDFPTVVRLGGVNLTDATVTNVNIARIIVHPDYNAANNYNDIALVELASEVKEMPACVWATDDVDHNNVTAIGYGQTQFAGVSSDQLLKASLFLVANDICSRYYEAKTEQLQRGIETTHICAGDPEHLRDTCQGDSGGPIITKVERDALYTYVVGITSFGRGCAGEPPSIYTRTSSYIDWIEDNVWPMPIFNIRNDN